MTPAHDADAQTVSPGVAQPNTKTQKPPLHGRKWIAITGKPLAATAGARIFERGGNAVDAACAMLAATSTMWDVLSWGGETQALIYDPRTRKVIAINGLGVAPTGATPEFFRKQGLKYPPAYGPLAAVTPGTPGGLMLMLAEFGTLSLADVLAPAIELADGYPIEAETANSIERNKDEARAVAVLAHDHAAASRAVARGTGCRRDLPSARSRGDAAQARRGRAAALKSRQVAPGRDPRGA